MALEPAKGQDDVVRGRTPGLAGLSMAAADFRSRTGATVIAVERNGDLLTDPDPGFVFEPDDELIVAGSDEFTELPRA